MLSSRPGCTVLRSRPGIGIIDGSIFDNGRRHYSRTPEYQYLSTTIIHPLQIQISYGRIPPLGRAPGGDSSNRTRTA